MVDWSQHGVTARVANLFVGMGAFWMMPSERLILLVSGHAWSLRFSNLLLLLSAAAAWVPKCVKTEVQNILWLHLQRVGT